MIGRNVLEIKLSEYGVSLGPRVLGQEIKRKVLDFVKDNADPMVIFNFEGITALSSGFCFDLFHGLKESLNDTFVQIVRFRFHASSNAVLLKSVIFKALTEKVE